MNLPKTLLMLALAPTCTSNAGPISRGGFVATSGGKLVDNTTLGCTTKYTGNPVLAGIND